MSAPYRFGRQLGLMPDCASHPPGSALPVNSWGTSRQARVELHHSQSTFGKICRLWLDFAKLHVDNEKIGATARAPDGTGQLSFDELQAHGHDI